VPQTLPPPEIDKTSQRRKECGGGEGRQGEGTRKARGQVESNKEGTWRAEMGGGGDSAWREGMERRDVKRG
jgi:hypothetical protein